MPASGSDPGSSGWFSILRPSPRSERSSGTGRAKIRRPSGVERKERSQATVICWLKGIPGNAMPRPQPIWMRRPSGALL